MEYLELYLHTVKLIKPWIKLLPELPQLPELPELPQLPELPEIPELS